MQTYMLICSHNKKGGDPVATKAQLKANKKYIQKTFKAYTFRVRRDSQSDLIKKLDSQENKNEYIIKALQNYEK